MTPERWRQIERIVKAALDLEPAGRAVFVAEECGADAVLRKDVESLLLADQQMGSFLETPPAAVAEGLLAADLANAATRPRSDGERRADSTARDAARRLARGAMLGRYLIVDLLGEGGMGVVYAAYDPDLNRKIAVKLLHPEGSGEDDPDKARGRLLREAQAMAQLSHPNVVAVHDVGTFGGEIFIAMDLIEGSTLKQWLAEKARGWRQILDLFLRAGEGLAAAHTAGIVHRDFKPDNVLVGHHGEVRVVDFGLARAADATRANEAAPTEPRGATESPSSSAIAARMTATGALAGTPAYMAPEQWARARTDARTDQFSFCAALYEALYGELPFAGDTIAALASATERGEVRAGPKVSGVPSWLRRTVLRGLRPDASDRYPSMASLLSELGRDRSKLRRQALMMTGVGLLFAAPAFGYHHARSQQRLLCRGAEAAMAGVWDADRKQAMSAAFFATHRSYAEDAVRGATSALDAYVGRWISMHTDACEATRLRGEQSEELLDLRMACLAERREELKTLTGLFASADEKLVTKAVEASQSLSDLARCSDLQALKAPIKLPRDDAARAKIADLRARLGAAKALHEAGKYPAALAAVTAAVAEARSLGYRPVEAEALFRLGHVQSLSGDFKAAVQTLAEATVAAQSGSHDEMAARAWSRLVWVGSTMGKFDDSKAWSGYAQATIDRMGGNPELELTLLNSLGVLHLKQAQYDQALDRFDRAIRIGEAAFGPDDMRLAATLNNIGVILRRKGKYDEARERFERSLAIRERTLGTTHPEICSPLLNIGTVLKMKGDEDGALVYYRRSLAIKEGALGLEHPSLAADLHNIGGVLLHQKKYAEALSHFERARNLNANALGAQHPEVAHNLVGVGESCLGLNLPDRALAPLEQAVAIEESRPGERAFLGEARFALARTLRALGRDERRAYRLAQQAREALTAAGEARPTELAEIDGWLKRRR